MPSAETNSRLVGKHVVSDKTYFCLSKANIINLYTWIASGYREARLSFSNKIFLNIQVGTDQEKGQSERNSHSKNRGGTN